MNIVPLSLLTWMLIKFWNALLILHLVLWWNIVIPQVDNPKYLGHVISSWDIFGRYFAWNSDILWILDIVLNDHHIQILRNSPARQILCYKLDVAPVISNQHLCTPATILATKEHDKKFFCESLCIWISIYFVMYCSWPG